MLLWLVAIALILLAGGEAAKLLSLSLALCCWFLLDDLAPDIVQIIARLCLQKIGLLLALQFLLLLLCLRLKLLLLHSVKVEQTTELWHFGRLSHRLLE